MPSKTQQGALLLPRGPAAPCAKYYSSQQQHKHNSTPHWLTYEGASRTTDKTCCTEKLRPLPSQTHMQRIPRTLHLLNCTRNTRPHMQRTHARMHCTTYTRHRQQPDNRTPLHRSQANCLQLWPHMQRIHAPHQCTTNTRHWQHQMCCPNPQA